MNAKDLIRLPDPREKVRADVREVVRDVRGKPHVFVRMKLTGWHFPHRAPEPFVAVGDVVSRKVVIDRAGLVAQAYFDAPLPAAERVSLGWGNIISVDFDIPVIPDRIPRLDRKRLPEGTLDPFGAR